ncbi:unnamed protein product [Rangifer tarandus platyrhynchus]|uniref:Uncharacterized protein n=3 Tax=Rangifer tarandus platyrhynchus TaxID=3082113 RepID=A0AC59ZS83_RANTA|nr:unnamed protein product [Rangifer tarandus platyrhynchus]CAI9708636.1 unnamed protein product [Rangifer tarandus platyrhynchus]
MGLRNRSERPTLQSEKGTKDGTRRDGGEGVRGPGIGQRATRRRRFRSPSDGVSGARSLGGQNAPKAGRARAAPRERHGRLPAEAPEWQRLQTTNDPEQSGTGDSGRQIPETAGGEAPSSARSPRAPTPRAPGPPPPAPAQSPPPRRRALPAASVEAVWYCLVRRQTLYLGFQPAQRPPPSSPDSHLGPSSQSVRRHPSSLDPLTSPIRGDWRCASVQLCACAGPPSRLWSALSSAHVRGLRAVPGRHLWAVPPAWPRGARASAFGLKLHSAVYPQHGYKMLAVFNLQCKVFSNRNSQ